MGVGQGPVLRLRRTPAPRPADTDAPRAGPGAGGTDPHHAAVCDVGRSLESVDGSSLSHIRSWQRAASADRLVDALRGEQLTRNPAGALQTEAPRLSHALARAEPAAETLAESRPPGHLLRISPQDGYSDLLTDLTAIAYGTADPRTKADLLNDALALWKGRPSPTWATWSSCAPRPTP